MAESFTITFQGGDEVDKITWDIKDGLEELDNIAATEDELDRWVPEIIITSDQVEPELEEFLMDVLKKIQTQSTTDETDFLDHI